MRLVLFTFTQSFGEEFSGSTPVWADSPEKNEGVLVKVRGRAVITQETPRYVAENVADGSAPSTYLGVGVWGGSGYANVHAGPKTLAKLFRTALDTPKFVVTSTKSQKIGSGYGDGALKLKRVGSKLFFVAPCGGKGWLTVAEAEKLTAELQSL